MEKYEQGHFGACPRVFCHSTHVLPCGRADMPGVDTVKLYCPNCGDIYAPPSSKYASVDGMFRLTLRIWQFVGHLPHSGKHSAGPKGTRVDIDAGAFFGTTFGPLFFQTYPELLSTPFFASTSTSTANSSPSPASPLVIGGETLVNPNAHGGQKAALGRVYVPRIYGFKVSERARSGPRMKWLRQRPERAEELDQVDWRGRFRDDKGIMGSAGDGDGRAGAGDRKRGRLFDEDDEKDEDDEEEEEEEEEIKPAVAPPPKVVTPAKSEVSAGAARKGSSKPGTPGSNLASGQSPRTGRR